MSNPVIDLNEFDCAIVGGGAAGLSAAVNLARMRRSVLVVDERDRFLWSHAAYNYLGFPDGIAGSELRRLGWRHAAKYGVRLLLGHVATGMEDDGRFRLRIERLRERGVGRRDPEIGEVYADAPDEGLEVTARSVILATGVLGHFPDFPGRDMCVGRSLFWCIHCGGYESIDRAVAVVGHDEEAVQTALDLLDFTDRVSIVAGRAEGFDVPLERLEDLSRNGIAAYPCAVAVYEHEAGQMRALVLDDPGSTRLAVDHVYTIRPTVAASDLARQLGVELNAGGQIVVDANQETNVAGVYAAGDVTCLNDHQLAAAGHEGNKAAFAASYYLYRPVQKAFAGR